MYDEEAEGDIVVGKTIALGLGWVALVTTWVGMMYCYTIGMMNGLTTGDYVMVIRMNAVGEFWVEWLFLLATSVFVVKTLGFVLKKHVWCR